VTNAVVLSVVAKARAGMEAAAARLEKRIDAVDAGFTALRGELAESTARIIAAIKAGA
jgi:hypothetical protein